MSAQKETSDVQYVGETYRYYFNNVEHLRVAFTAAHRSDRDGIKYDGYRRFAPLGVSALDLVSAHSELIPDVYTRRELSLASSVFAGSQCIDLATRRQSWIRNKAERANIARALDLGPRIVLSVRQQGQPPSRNVLATAMSALIGAMWQDMLEQNKSVLDCIEVILRVISTIGYAYLS